MARTINSAFNAFNKDIVNLDSNRTKLARTSRDNLISTLDTLHKKNEDIPVPFSEKHIKFGSFARNTKIHPLDDIDLLFCLDGGDASYKQESTTFIIHTNYAYDRLSNLSDDNILNSKKVVNIYKKHLSEIHHYQNAELHRNQEAVTLQLSSYEWNFDIVPAFYTDKGFYLIPDGKGNWKATNPPIDQKHVTEVNNTHKLSVLQLIRTLKYWNKHANNNLISSYLFENFVLNFCKTQSELSDDLYINIFNFWIYLYNNIDHPVEDPKGIQTDLNNLESNYLKKIKKNIERDHNFVQGSRYEEDLITNFGSVFGNKFPKYN